MASERLADEGERANVEAVVHAAIGLRHGVTQPAARSQSAHEVAAGAVDVLLVITIPKLRFAPAFEMLGEPPEPLIKERPVQKGAIRHQSPLNPGLRFAAEASKARRKWFVAMQIAWACASLPRSTEHSSGFHSP